MKLSKPLLKEKCIAVIQERIDLLLASMAAAQEAANEETKSSAGDKYETARAMNQLEKDMLARQVAENKRELAAMVEVDCSGRHDRVAAGSLVRCAAATYFILGGLGKLTLDKGHVWVISPKAPLAMAMLGKSGGDKVMFNGKEMEILEVD